MKMYMLRRVNAPEYVSEVEIEGDVVDGVFVTIARQYNPDLADELHNVGLCNSQVYVYTFREENRNDCRLMLLKYIKDELNDELRDAAKRYDVADANYRGISKLYDMHNEAKQNQPAAPRIISRTKCHLLEPLEAETWTIVGVDGHSNPGHGFRVPTDMLTGNGITKVGDRFEIIEAIEGSVVTSRYKLIKDEEKE